MVRKKIRKRGIVILWKGRVIFKPVGGIYKIWFDEKYYIGRTKNLMERKRQHQSNINVALRTECTGRNTGFYCKIYDHLMTNTEIRIAKMEILMTSDDELTLIKREIELVNSVIKDKNCLNLKKINVYPFSI